MLFQAMLGRSRGRLQAGLERLLGVDVDGCSVAIHLLCPVLGTCPQTIPAGDELLIPAKTSGKAMGCRLAPPALGSAHRKGQHKPTAGQGELWGGKLCGCEALVPPWALSQWLHSHPGAVVLGELSSACLEIPIAHSRGHPAQLCRTTGTTEQPAMLLALLGELQL